jgi:hypothetical protein
MIEYFFGPLKGTAPLTLPSPHRGEGWGEQAGLTGDLPVTVNAL